MGKEFFYALSVLIGTIVGVGIFAIPYAAHESGFFVVVAYLAVLTLVVIIIHLLWGEILLRTSEDHRLPGLARIYLGEMAAHAAQLLTLFGALGSLLVYALVGGVFLSGLFGGGNEVWYILAFWAGCSALIALGIKTLEISEFFMSLFLVAIIGGVLYVAYPQIDSANFYTFFGDKLFFPYGIIFFSLLGTVAVPEVRTILRENERFMKKALIFGTVIPALLYFIFTIAILGVSGEQTSKDALYGFGAILGDGFIAILYVFGFLVIATSYLTLGTYLKKTFLLDFSFSRMLSIALTAFIPLSLIFLGLRDFIAVISVMGGVLGGIEGIIVLCIHREAQKRGTRAPEYSLTLGKFGYAILFIVFLGGIVVTLLQSEF